MEASISEKDIAFQRSRLAKLPWWVFVLTAAGIILIFLILATPNYKSTFIYLSSGILVTLRITFFSFFAATVIGLIFGLGRVSKNTVIYNIATLYVETIRGIPMIVLILYIAFALIPALKDAIVTFGQDRLLQAPDNAFFQNLANFNIRWLENEVRAIIALSIGYGAFEAEVFRAGIQSIGKGQMEAAKSLGMTYFQAMRFIVLPQAVRRVLPPLGNDFIACLKDSALVTVLAVNDITQLGRIRRSSTFRQLESYNVVAFLYLSMTLLLSVFVRWLEHRMKIEE